MLRHIITLSYKPSLYRPLFQSRRFHFPPTSSSRTRDFMMSNSVDEFHACLQKSSRILTLVGAGLSASSGLPTFRGNGGMWKSYEATLLATPQAFEADPGLVWQFYAYRRHMALKARPNPAHFAIAELGRKMDGESGRGESVTISQNVDGLSQRASHPPRLLHLVHGSLFTIKCSSESCGYMEHNNFNDPLCPSLDVSGLSPELDDNTASTATSRLHSRIVLPDSKAFSPGIKKEDLPHCPKCSSLLRPGVVWFGEPLPLDTLNDISAWIEKGAIDIMLVVGTTAEVYPAANYINIARRKGARIAVVNMDAGHLGASGTLGVRDWMFEGDAGTLVPQLLEPVIGTLDYSTLGGDI